MSWNGTVTCSHCWEQGHNRSKCPAREQKIEELRKEDPIHPHVERYDREQKNKKSRSCGYCGSGNKNSKSHNVRSCPEMKEHIEVEIDNNKIYRAVAYEHLKGTGFGVGALIKVNNYTVSGYDTIEALGFVESIDWGKISDPGRYGWRMPQAIVVSMQKEDYYGRTKDLIAIPFHPDLCQSDNDDHGDKYEIVVSSEKVDPPLGWFDMKDKPKELRNKIREMLKDEGHYYVKHRQERREEARATTPE